MSGLVPNVCLSRRNPRLDLPETRVIVAVVQRVILILLPSPVVRSRVRQVFGLLASTESTRCWWLLVLPMTSVLLSGIMLVLALWFRISILWCTLLPK